MIESRPLKNRRGKAFVTQNACNECKKKRAKCDGNQPCGRCLALNAEACDYTVPTRVSKEAMRTRIMELEVNVKHSARVLDLLSSENDRGLILEQLGEGKSLEEIYNSLTARQASPNKINFSKQDASDTCPQSSNTDSGLSTSTIRNGNPYVRSSVQTQDPCPNTDASWTTVTADSELVTHLHSLYFCWEYPIFSIPSKDHFILGRETKQLKYCSSLLVNVIAALGCRFSDRPGIKANLNNGEKFYLEAQRLWKIEQDNLSLTTIQATALMSLWETSHGRDNMGSFYARQAISMAVEAGLHNRHMDASNAEADVEICNATFWGTFILDQLWSLCLGRLPHFSCRGSSVIPTLIMDDKEQMRWVPYIDKGMPLNRSAAQPGNVGSMFRGICELSKIAYRSLYFLYSPGRCITSKDVMDIYLQYLNWYNDVQGVLKRGTNFTPTALFSHMYYHFSILLLFGPFIDLRLLGYSVVPREICNQAANALNAIVYSYRELYSLRRTHSFMPYFSLVSSIVHLMLVNADCSQIDGNFTKVLQGVSYLDEMTPSHIFAGCAKNKLRAMANRSMLGEGWLQNDDKEDQSYHNDRSVNYTAESESILLRRFDTLESSSFSPYPGQVSSRVDYHEKLRFNGFELIT